MSFKAKVPLITLGLMAAMTLSGAAHAANPLEQIVNQGVEKFQQRGNDRSNDRGSDNERYSDRHDDREHRGRHGQHGRKDDDHHNDANASCRDELSMRSIQGNVHTSMKFVNRTNHEIRSYWLDYSGRRVFYKAIPPNGNYTQPTFQTHPWVITDQRDNCLAIYVSNQPSVVVEIH
jgi:von Hippel-Lindau disease tumor supressor